MRKIWVIACREYQAAVRTKAFIISLLALPLLMGGSILLQLALRGFVDISDKKFVLVDYAGSSELVRTIEAKLAERNTKTIFDSGRQQLRPRFIIDRILRPGASASAAQRLKLSDEVRAGKLVGFLELSQSPAPHPLPLSPKGRGEGRVTLRYHSNRATDNEFADFVRAVLEGHLRTQLADKAGLSPAQTAELLRPLDYSNKGLAKRDAATGKIEDTPEESRFISIIMPVCLMMLMFMVIMMTATPLMQGVVEEKMQRIAEVLLGSVRPFELMSGKLLGMVAVSLTVAMLYLTATYWTIHQFGFAEYVQLELVAWFVIYQALAALMFGSMFIAVGAACTDMKETQSLLWPVMLLASFPLFLLATVIKEPNSSVARGLSLAPFATPTLMIARQAIPPGPQWWEPLLGIVLVLATTILCVFAAGRIFRVGILIQGKGAHIGELLRWIIRG